MSSDAASQTTPAIPEPGPLPEGMVVREAAKADVPALFALLQAEDLAATGESSLVVATVQHWFDSERARRRGVTRVLEREGEFVGLWRVYRNFDDKYWVQVAVDRRLPGATVDALWRAGLHWVEVTALAIADSLGVDRPRLDAWVCSDDALTRRHAEAAGYEQTRAFIEMQLELADYRGPAPDPQVTIRRADIDGPDSPDLRLMHALVTASFRDHFDFIERPYDEWVQNRLDDPLNDFTHWYIAAHDGVDVGALIGHNGYIEVDNAGYIANLGVLREGRGKGVAKALLHTSFARYAADGRVAVKLEVDAESPTGATHLYESVGMYRRMVGFDFFKWPRGKG
ncbi:GNAT family N-acetyltransferase [Micropruina sp.]|uniref:GNAT family N-acetyltransferase n=1 Tax=Micropruina sp. TaxID=2737536 RepID=UPI0039E5040C